MTVRAAHELQMVPRCSTFDVTDTVAWLHMNWSHMMTVHRPGNPGLRSLPFPN